MARCQAILVAQTYLPSDVSGKTRTCLNAHATETAQKRASFRRCADRLNGTNYGFTRASLQFGSDKLTRNSTRAVETSSGRNDIFSKCSKPNPLFQETADPKTMRNAQVEAVGLPIRGNRKTRFRPRHCFMFYPEELRRRRPYSRCLLRLHGTKTRMSYEKLMFYTRGP